MSEYITVQSKLKANPDGSYPVAFWEVDPAHPGGEVFVAGPKLVEVAETGAVAGAIQDGRLRRVKAAAPEPAAEDEEEEAAETSARSRRTRKAADAPE